MQRNDASEKSSLRISMIETEASGEQIKAVETAVKAALAAENAEDKLVSVVLTTDEVIREYNREYRSVDRSTDVLSFPTNEGEDLITPPDGFIGDIMISIPRAEEQGKALGHSTEREIMFLAVHGVLHLLGYDHMAPEDEAVMLPKQREIISLIEGKTRRAHDDEGKN